MERTNNLGISTISIVDNLKALVGKKINLEKKALVKSSEYLANNKEIESLITRLPADKLKMMKIYINDDINNLNNFLKSDILEGVIDDIRKRLDVDYGCIDIIDRFLSLNTNKEKSR